ncbi:hypothetical protein, conserved [Trypanosoma brucei brucei TREU927]|uniref:Uncharacterized protein n=1 Tax=Trypanosoma brucei brucei (strain 927/4 GUTat10.1) TaxID=185431 RepID=Q4GYA8_TRYB2|nr:hypothetical protein, conserved [Trypanosoma brucei brucei TREU927]CAJ16676.1 hypothetical protein, conserved [Trypanosoma brucei brucei TREU927]
MHTDDKQAQRYPRTSDAARVHSTLRVGQNTSDKVPYGRLSSQSGPGTPRGDLFPPSNGLSKVEGEETPAAGAWQYPSEPMATPNTRSVQLNGALPVKNEEGETKCSGDAIREEGTKDGGDGVIIGIDAAVEAGVLVANEESGKEDENRESNVNSTPCASGTNETIATATPTLSNATAASVVLTPAVPASTGLRASRRLLDFTGSTNVSNGPRAASRLFDVKPVGGGAQAASQGVGFLRLSKTVPSAASQAVSARMRTSRKNGPTLSATSRGHSSTAHENLPCRNDYTSLRLKEQRRRELYAWNEELRRQDKSDMSADAV